MTQPMSDIWTHWHGHPDALIGLTLLEGLYLLAVGPMRTRFGMTEAASPKELLSFTTGVMVIFMALLSPIHILSDQYLFSMHMFQHIMLTLIAPPLLILGVPARLLKPITSNKITFRVASILTSPIFAIISFNLVFSIWHIPALYNLSMEFHSIHISEHLLFIAVAVLMWWPLTSKVRELPRLSYPLQIVYLIILSIAQIIVFAMITFSTEPLYEWYVNAPMIWGITPVADQQIGAIIMKIGGSAIFMSLIIILFFKWVRIEHTKSQLDSIEITNKTV